MMCWMLIFAVVTTLRGQHFPFLTDPGSFSGSGVAIGFYEALDASDKNNRTRMIEFEKDYVKRQLYFMGASLAVGTRINSEMAAAFSRYDSLKTRNSSLTQFSYSKKKDNTKMLNMIEIMLNSMQREMLTHKNVFVIYGEKINLLQNMMKSLIEIQRVMDIVEDNLEKTKLYNRIFN